MASTKDSIAINTSSTNKIRVIGRIGSDGNEIDNIGIVNVIKIRMAKSRDLVKTGAGFFIPGTRLMFIELRQVFIKAYILHVFDLKCHIWVKTDILEYVIGNLESSDFRQLQLIAFGGFLFSKNDFDRDLL